MVVVYLRKKKYLRDSIVKTIKEKRMVKDGEG